jgi:hypothetical protein
MNLDHIQYSVILRTRKTFIAIIAACGVLSARGLNFMTYQTNHHTSQLIAPLSVCNFEHQHYASQLSVIFRMSNSVILAINAGSSSIKYSLYEKTSSNTVSLLLNASISGLTAPPSQFTYSLYQSSETHPDQGKQGNKDIQGTQGTEIESSKAQDVDVSNHEDAFKYFIEFLKNGKGRKEGKGNHGIMDLKRVHVVCHRIVHGGPEPRPLIITEEELHHLDELSDLAPLYIPSPPLPSPISFLSSYSFNRLLASLRSKPAMRKFLSIWLFASTDLL